MPAERDPRRLLFPLMGRNQRPPKLTSPGLRAVDIFSPFQRPPRRALGPANEEKKGHHAKFRYVTRDPVRRSRSREPGGRRFFAPRQPGDSPSRASFVSLSPGQAGPRLSRRDFHSSISRPDAGRSSAPRRRGAKTGASDDPRGLSSETREARPSRATGARKKEPVPGTL